ncbi:hypothetical protein Tco_0912735, partial [Tanacetum coccineum]
VPQTPSKWKSKSFSFGGRLTLIKSVLGSLGVYYFSSFKAPKKVICELESIRRKFFWGGGVDENKISWIAWDKVISPRDKGGLNIGSLSVSNQAMLLKWWWRLKTEDQALWCKVICSIHGPCGGLHDNSYLKPNSGPWYHILKLKDELLNFGISLTSLFKRKIGNGQKTSFWNDIWLGGSPLSVSFPRLYRLESNLDCCVYERSPTIRQPSSVLAPVDHSSGTILGSGPTGFLPPPGLIFKWAWSRVLHTTHEIEKLIGITSLLSHRNLSQEEDSWEFSMDALMKFTVKSIDDIK